MKTIIPTTPTHPQRTAPDARFTDQTWDEYQSTQYFLARLRGEQPDVRDTLFGVDVPVLGGVG